jgi:hypothetical protein
MRISILITLLTALFGFLPGFQSFFFPKIVRKTSISNNIIRSYEHIERGDDDPVNRREVLRGILLEKADQFVQKREALWQNDTADGKGLFGAESRGTATINLDDDAKQIIGLIEELVKLNPTPTPTLGWQGCDATSSATQLYNLDGMWKLRFTTATDAIFKPGKRGPATTMQYVNSTISTFTNVVDFKENKGKVKGFRVVVEGKASNGTRVDLNFKKVIIERRSKFPRLFGTVTIPLPSLGFLQRIAGSKDKDGQRSRGAYFNILYLDDEMRIHLTGDGNYFVQTRLYEAWDPSVGWTYVSCT